MKIHPIQTYSNLVLGLLGFLALTSVQGQVQQSGLKSTQFDGVSSDYFVSYANFDQMSSLTTSLVNSDGKDMDYTIGLWFKVLNDPADSTLFYITDTIQCSFLIGDRILCESRTKCGKLNVDAGEVRHGAWTHLTMTGQQGEYSLLVIQNNEKLIDQQLKPYVVVRQQASPWSVSFGNIPDISTEPFIGGIRDFIFTSKATPYNALTMTKNRYHSWQQYILGYYRFDFNSGINDEFRSSQYTEIKVDKMDPETNKTISVPQYELPSIQNDLIPNDICNQFVSQEQFLTVDEDFMFKTITLDSKRFDFTKRFYDYTFSIWLKIDADTGTTKRGYHAARGDNIFKFEEVFTLYMSESNQARFYFHALKNFYEVPSQAFFVPTDQWVNIQLNVNQYQGYEIHVYDAHADLVQKIKDNSKLAEQRPSGKVRMFDNFRGQVKSVVLLDKEVSLPYVPEDRWNETQKHMLFYFNFQPTDFDNGKFIGIEKENKKTQSFIAKGEVSFDYSSFVNFYFDPQLTRASLMYQSNFDGLACNDSSYNIMLTSRESFIKQKLMNVNQPTKYLTVEFWFFLQDHDSMMNISNTNSTFEAGNLFTLTEESTNTTALIISLDDKKTLQCDPIGNSNDVLDLGPVYFDTWYKVTCSFQTQMSAEASLFSNNVQLSSDYKNLTNSSSFIPSGNYTFILGNGKDYESGVAHTGYRELAVWNSSFSLADKKNEQLYVYDYNSDWLLSYIRLASGTQDVIDLAYLLDPENREPFVEVVDVMPFIEDSLLICPQQTLFYNGDCYETPFISLNLVALPIWNETEKTLYFHFTTHKSEYLDESLVSDVVYQWKFYDSILDSMYGDIATSSQTIPSYAFRNEASYQIEVIVTNQEQSYQLIEIIQFVPVSCRFYKDSISGMVDTSRTITSPKSSSDVSFEIQLATQNPECNSMSFFNVPYVSGYKVFGDIIATPNIEFDINVADYSIVAKIPQGEQHKFSAPGVEGPSATIAITIAWTSSMFEDFIDQSAGVVFQDIVYHIQFSESEESVVPILEPNFLSILKGETLVLDGSTTYINTTQQDAGELTFSWTCPNDLVTLCEAANQAGNSIFQISYDDYAELGVFNTQMTFTMNVLWSKPDSTELTFKVSQNITWTEIEVPIVTLNEPNKFLHTKANVFSLEFNTNYVDQSDRGSLSYTWVFTPPITDPVNKLVFSNNDTVCTILEGGLDEQTSYNMSVKVAHVSHSRAYAVVSSNFETSIVPNGGVVGSDPPTGNNETEMEFFIKDWQSASAPVQYKLWAQTNEGQELMTLNWLDESVNHTTFPINNFPVIFQITDGTGEEVLIEYSISTGQSDETDIVILKAQLESAPTAFARINILKAMSSKDVNGQDKRIILSELIKNTENLSAKSDSDDDVENVKSAPQILANILDKVEDLDDDFIQKVLTILAKVMSSKNIFRDMTKEQDFRQNFVRCISSLLSYTDYRDKQRKLISTATQTGVHEANGAIFDLLDDFLLINCDTTEEYLSTQSVIVSGMLIKYQKVPKTSLEVAKKVELSFGQLTSILNMTDYFRVGTETTKSICAGTTFVENVSFNDDETLSQATDANIKQFAFVDDGLEVTQIDMTAAYMNSYSISIDTRYKHNQTQCMLYNEETLQWEDEECMTDLSQAVDGKVSCTCNTLNGKFMGMFTDISRVHDKSLLAMEDPMMNGQSESAAVKYSFISLVVVVLITMFIASIKLDKRDIRTAETTKAELSQHFISMYAKKTQDHDNIVLLKSEELSLYLKMPELTTARLMRIVLGSYHPATSILTRFDVEESRVSRFFMYMFQFSVVLLILFGISTSIPVDELTWTFIICSSASAAIIMTIMQSLCRIKWFNNRRVFKREDTQQNSESAKGIAIDEEDAGRQTSNDEPNHQLQMKYTCVLQVPKLELILFGVLIASCHAAVLIMATQQGVKELAYKSVSSHATMYACTLAFAIAFQYIVLALTVKTRKGAAGRIVRNYHLVHTVKQELIDSMKAREPNEEDDVSASRMTEPAGSKTVQEFGSSKNFVEVEARAMQSCQKQIDIWDPIFIDDSNEKMRKSTGANNDKKKQADVKAVTKPRYSTLNWQVTNE